MSTLQELLALNEADKADKAECKFCKGDVVRLTKSAFKKASKADGAKMGAEDASAKVKDNMFGGTKITFSKDFHGKKMWDVKDLEVAKVSEDIIAEAKEYGDSSDFESDASAVDAKFKEISKIVLGKEWMNWMKETDNNFSTSGGSALALNRKLSDKLNDAIHAYNDLYDHLVKVSES